MKVTNCVCCIQKLLAFDYGESDDEDGGKLVDVSRDHQHHQQTEQSVQQLYSHSMLQPHHQHVMTESHINQPPPAMPLMHQQQPVLHQPHLPVYPPDG